MGWFPDEPDVPPSQVGEGESRLRYEDVSQDGRVMLTALPHALGDALWRRRLVDHPLSRAGSRGVIPILTRFVIERLGGPLSVRNPLSTVGRYQLAHTVDAAGAVDRLLLLMWTRSSAPRANMYGPAPDGAGEAVAVGRVFAEHVFTRLFAPPEARKVLAFDVEGVAPVPPSRWTWRAFDEVLALPPGAEPLDEAPVADDAPVAFGLHHTDANQHVNSLVYPHLFQDAALRRFAARGRSTRLHPARLEIAYRKPCFAGDRARILLRAFSVGEQLGAAGAFVADDGRPYCALQVTFTP